MPLIDFDSGGLQLWISRTNAFPGCFYGRVQRENKKSLEKIWTWTKHQTSSIRETRSFKCTKNKEEYSERRNSNVSSASTSCYEQNRTSCESSPCALSPWKQTSPFENSSWKRASSFNPFIEEDDVAHTGLLGSIVREEGHVYSLACSGDLLYIGSDSKNIRVWKNHKEFSGFKCTSGLVKAIVISGGKIFTGHQDGKIRVWKISSKKPNVHKRIGTLPTYKAYVKNSMKTKNYVENQKQKKSLSIRHSDAISSLSLDEDHGFLYSASWDRTLKVWRLSDYKCLESISAHTDVINSVVTCFDGTVFTGSADGTVKVWKREFYINGTRHLLLQTLLTQDSAVTALAIDPSGSILYSGSSDGLINFWDKEKHISHGGILKEHTQGVLCLAAAGNLVISGSADKNICVWRRDREGHTRLKVLTGHTEPVKCLVIEDEGETAEGLYTVYSGSLDKSVKVWRVWEESPPDADADPVSADPFTPCVR